MGSADDNGDCIFLRGLTVDCIIGFIDWERQMPQTVVIDLTLPCDCAQAALTDAVADTLDYKVIAKRVLAWVGASQFQLVETLAHRLALLLLTEFPLPWVRVSVNKPGAIRHSRDVGVSILRSRAQLAGRLSGICGRVSEAFVAIGSNLDPMTHVLAAANALKARYHDIRFSRCYRNRAVGFEGPDFINAVMSFSTDQPVPALLATLREIELACGRDSDAQRWGPRGMDLDLLLYDDLVEDGLGYRLPRPDLRLRAYMLGPLAELAPQRRYPPSGPTLKELWERFPQAEHPLEPLDLDLNAI